MQTSIAFKGNSHGVSSFMILNESNRIQIFLWQGLVHPAESTAKSAEVTQGGNNGKTTKN